MEEQNNPFPTQDELTEYSYIPKNTPPQALNFAEVFTQAGNDIDAMFDIIKRDNVQLGMSEEDLNKYRQEKNTAMVQYYNQYKLMNNLNYTFDTPYSDAIQEADESQQEEIIRLQQGVYIKGDPLTEVTQDGIMERQVLTEKQYAENKGFYLDKNNNYKPLKEADANNVKLALQYDEKENEYVWKEFNDDETINYEQVRGRWIPTIESSGVFKTIGRSIAKNTAGLIPEAIGTIWAVTGNLIDQAWHGDADYYNSKAAYNQFYRDMAYVSSQYKDMNYDQKSGIFNGWAATTDTMVGGLVQLLGIMATGFGTGMIVKSGLTALTRGGTKKILGKMLTKEGINSATRKTGMKAAKLMGAGQGASSVYGQMLAYTDDEAFAAQMGFLFGSITYASESIFENTFADRMGGAWAAKIWGGEEVTAKAAKEAFKDGAEKAGITATISNGNFRNMTESEKKYVATRFFYHLKKAQAEVRAWSDKTPLLDRLLLDPAKEGVEEIVEGIGYGMLGTMINGRNQEWANAIKPITDNYMVIPITELGEQDAYSVQYLYGNYEDKYAIVNKKNPKDYKLVSAAEAKQFNLNKDRAKKILAGEYKLQDSVTIDEGLAAFVATFEMGVITSFLPGGMKNPMPKDRTFSQIAVDTYSTNEDVRKRRLEEIRSIYNKLIQTKDIDINTISIAKSFGQNSMDMTADKMVNMIIDDLEMRHEIIRRYGLDSIQQKYADNVGQYLMTAALTSALDVQAIESNLKRIENNEKPSEYKSKNSELEIKETTTKEELEKLYEDYSLELNRYLTVSKGRTHIDAYSDFMYPVFLLDTIKEHYISEQQKNGLTDAEKKTIRENASKEFDQSMYNPDPNANIFGKELERLSSGGYHILLRPSMIRKQIFDHLLKEEKSVVDKYNSDIKMNTLVQDSDINNYLEDSKGVMGIKSMIEDVKTKRQQKVSLEAELTNLNNALSGAKDDIEITGINDSIKSITQQIGDLDGVIQGEIDEIGNNFMFINDTVLKGTMRFTDDQRQRVMDTFNKFKNEIYNDAEQDFTEGAIPEEIQSLEQLYDMEQNGQVVSGTYKKYQEDMYNLFISNYEVFPGVSMAALISSIASDPSSFIEQHTPTNARIISNVAMHYLKTMEMFIKTNKPYFQDIIEATDRNEHSIMYDKPRSYRLDQEVEYDEKYDIYNINPAYTSTNKLLKNIEDLKTFINEFKAKIDKVASSDQAYSNKVRASRVSMDYEAIKEVLTLTKASRKVAGKDEDAETIITNTNKEIEDIINDFLDDKKIKDPKDIITLNGFADYLDRVENTSKNIEEVNKLVSKIQRKVYSLYTIPTKEQIEKGYDLFMNNVSKMFSHMKGINNESDKRYHYNTIIGFIANERLVSKIEGDPVYLSGETFISGRALVNKLYTETEDKKYHGAVDPLLKTHTNLRIYLLSMQNMFALINRMDGFTMNDLFLDVETVQNDHPNLFPNTVEQTDTMIRVAAFLRNSDNAMLKKHERKDITLLDKALSISSPGGIGKTMLIIPETIYLFNHLYDNKKINIVTISNDVAAAVKLKFADVKNVSVYTQHDYLNKKGVEKADLTIVDEAQLLNEEDVSKMDKIRDGSKLIFLGDTTQVTRAKFDSDEAKSDIVIAKMNLGVSAVSAAMNRSEYLIPISTNKRNDSNVSILFTSNILKNLYISNSNGVKIDLTDSVAGYEEFKDANGVIRKKGINYKRTKKEIVEDFVNEYKARVAANESVDSSVMAIISLNKSDYDNTLKMIKEIDPSIDPSIEDNMLIQKYIDTDDKLRNKVTSGRSITDVWIAYDINDNDLIPRKTSRITSALKAYYTSATRDTRYKVVLNGYTAYDDQKLIKRVIGTSFTPEDLIAAKDYNKTMFDSLLDRSGATIKPKVNDDFEKLIEAFKTDLKAQEGKVPSDDTKKHVTDIIYEYYNNNAKERVSPEELENIKDWQLMYRLIIQRMYTNVDTISDALDEKIKSIGRKILEYYNTTQKLGKTIYDDNVSKFTTSVKNKIIPNFSKYGNIEAGNIAVAPMIETDYIAQPLMIEVIGYEENTGYPVVKLIDIFHTTTESGEPGTDEVRLGIERLQKYFAYASILAGGVTLNGTKYEKVIVKEIETTEHSSEKSNIRTKVISMANLSPEEINALQDIQTIFQNVSKASTEPVSLINIETVIDYIPNTDEFEGIDFNESYFAPNSDTPVYIDRITMREVNGSTFYLIYAENDQKPYTPQEFLQYYYANKKTVYNQFNRNAKRFKDTQTVNMILSSLAWNGNMTDLTSLTEESFYNPASNPAINIRYKIIDLLMNMNPQDVMFEKAYHKSQSRYSFKSGKVSRDTYHNVIEYRLTTDTADKIFENEEIQKLTTKEDFYNYHINIGVANEPDFNYAIKEKKDDARSISETLRDRLGLKETDDFMSHPLIIEYANAMTTNFDEVERLEKIIFENAFSNVDNNEDKGNLLNLNISRLQEIIKLHNGYIKNNKVYALTTSENHAYHSVNNSLKPISIKKLVDDTSIKFGEIDINEIEPGYQTFNKKKLFGVNIPVNGIYHFVIVYGQPITKRDDLGIVIKDALDSLDTVEQSISENIRQLADEETRKDYARKAYKELEMTYAYNFIMNNSGMLFNIFQDKINDRYGISNIFNVGDNRLNFKKSNYENMIYQLRNVLNAIREYYSNEDMFDTKGKRLEYPAANRFTDENGETRLTLTDKAITNTIAITAGEFYIDEYGVQQQTNTASDIIDVAAEEYTDDYPFMKSDDIDNIIMDEEDGMNEVRMLIPSFFEVTTPQGQIIKGSDTVMGRIVNMKELDRAVVQLMSFKGKVHKYAPRHEAMHVITEYLISKNEARQVVAEAKTLMRSRGREGRISDAQAYEFISDIFMDKSYMNIVTDGRSMLRKFLDWLQKLVSEWFNIKTQRNLNLYNLFKNAEMGKYRNAQIMQNPMDKSFEQRNMTIENSFNTEFRINAVIEQFGTFVNIARVIDQDIISVFNNRFSKYSMNMNTSNMKFTETVREFYNYMLREHDAMMEKTRIIDINTGMMDENGKYIIKKYYIGKKDDKLDPEIKKFTREQYKIIASDENSYDRNASALKEYEWFHATNRPFIKTLMQIAFKEFNIEDFIDNLRDYRGADAINFFRDSDRRIEENISQKQSSILKFQLQSLPRIRKVKDKNGNETGYDVRIDPVTKDVLYASNGTINRIIIEAAIKVKANQSENLNNKNTFTMKALFEQIEKDAYAYSGIVSETALGIHVRYGNYIHQSLQDPKYYSYAKEMTLNHQIAPKEGIREGDKTKYIDANEDAMKRRLMEYYLENMFVRAPKGTANTIFIENKEGKIIQYEKRLKNIGAYKLTQDKTILKVLRLMIRYGYLTQGEVISLIRNEYEFISAINTWASSITKRNPAYYASGEITESSRDFDMHMSIQRTLNNNIINNINNNEQLFNPGDTASRFVEISDAEINQLINNGSIIKTDENAKDCIGGVPKAEAGMLLGFTPGGTWELMDILEGASHKQGGIDLSISNGNVYFSQNNSKIYAAKGLVVKADEKKKIEDEFVEFKNKKISKRIYPQVEKIYNEINKLASEKGYSAIITDGLRTFDEQKKISKSNTQSPVSHHNFGEAIDIAFVNNATGALDYEQKELYDKLGEIVAKEGMFWGGSWKGFVDKPHIQFYKNSAEAIRQNPERKSIYAEHLDYYNDLLKKKKAKKEDTTDLEELILELNKKENISIPAESPYTPVTDNTNIITTPLNIKIKKR